MSEWLHAHRALLWGSVVASVVMLVATIVLLPFFVVRLPADYFVHRRRHRVPHPHLAWFWIGRIARNLIGVVMLLAGLAMLVLPGQGLLTLLVALTLLEFPGKFRLERWLVRRGPLLRLLNWLRARRGVEPLLAPDG